MSIEKQQKRQASKGSNDATKPKMSFLNIQRILTGAKVFTPRTQILCYGDSLTAGFVDPHTFYPYSMTLESSLGIPIDHAGMCGWTTLEMVQKSTSAVCGLSNLLSLTKQQPQYKLCIIMSGTNDLSAGHTPIEIFQNLQTLHEVCHSAGLFTVAVSILQSRLNHDGKSSIIHEFQQETNKFLREYAEKTVPTKCLYVDMESVIPWSKQSPFWSSDGLHMSKEGYEEMGRLLAPRIQHWVIEARIY